MIPIQLTLKNFLSYREAALDFRGLHTACICGPNGAGKSSLLEAITWAVWGCCRSDSEDEIIHMGEIDVRVDFTFSTGDQIYRVIRNRRRGQSGSLEFQVATNPPFPPLSKGGPEEVNYSLGKGTPEEVNSSPPLSKGGLGGVLDYRGQETQPLSPPLSKGGLGGVIHHLRSHRCLIILDDVQTIFSSQQLAGNYQPGYENYGPFFKQIAESSHNSCLILLSWEKPREIAALESQNKNCQTLQLNGLGEAAREIFTKKGLAESEKWSELIELYQGNPLWLNIVAAGIQDLFSGKISDFLSYDSLVLGDLEYLLHQHFQRLSETEKQVLCWLANQNKPVEISKKPALLELSPSEFLKAVESLRRRLLIEKVQKGDRTLFQLQPAIAEYIKERIK